jgi:HD-like signal output (HDOD) protein
VAAEGVPMNCDSAVQLDAYLDAHQKLHALPDNTMRIVRRINDSACTIAELQRLISQDTALAARLLQAVNSSFYALESKITRLDRGIAFMGLRAVKEVAMSACLNSVAKPLPLGKYDARDLWDHSVGVGIVARELAAHNPAIDAEEAFLAGMLLDIALLLVAESEPAKATQLLEQAEGGMTSFCQLETQIMGFDHCQLGQRLAQSWRFPEQVCAAIRWHHDPASAPAEHAAFCTHLHIADSLCCQAGVGYTHAGIGQQISQKQMTLTRLTSESTAAVVEKLPLMLRLFLN